MADTWTPRERVLAALNHQEPDMVPLDLGGTNCTTLTRQAYHSLRAYLGMPPDPDPNDPGRVRGLREGARKLYEQTDYALVADLMCPGPFEGGCTLQGYDQFLADFYLDPPLAEALLDRFTDLTIGFWDAFLSVVGDYVQVIGQGDDIGIQRGLYISPEMCRRVIKPRHQRLFGFIHSKTRARIHLHSCGSVVEAIPDLIEAGVDILSPVQRSAANMDLARLKADFGRDICFWGGPSISGRYSPTRHWRRSRPKSGVRWRSWRRAEAMSSSRPTTSSPTSPRTGSTASISLRSVAGEDGPAGSVPAHAPHLSMGAGLAKRGLVRSGARECALPRHERPPLQVRVARSAHDHAPHAT